MYYTRRKNLVANVRREVKIFLDLDETLVHSYSVREFPGIEDGSKEYIFGIKTLKRPNLIYFLYQLINEGHELEILTYADLRYATAVCRGIGMPIEKITSMRELNVPLKYKERDWLLVDDLGMSDKLKYICDDGEAEEHLIKIYQFKGDDKDDYLNKTLKIINYINDNGGSVNVSKYRRCNEIYMDLISKKNICKEDELMLSAMENNASLWGAIMDIEEKWKTK